MEVKHKETKQVFAIKKIRSAFCSATDARRTYREVFYLRGALPAYRYIILLKSFLLTHPNNFLRLGIGVLLRIAVGLHLSSRGEKNFRRAFAGRRRGRLAERTRL